jgi:hypothetical protein
MCRGMLTRLSTLAATAAEIASDLVVDVTAALPAPLGH